MFWTRILLELPVYLDKTYKNVFINNKQIRLKPQFQKPLPSWLSSQVYTGTDKLCKLDKSS